MMYIRVIRRTGGTFASHMDSISGIVTRDAESLIADSVMVYSIERRRVILVVIPCGNDS